MTEKFWKVLPYNVIPVVLNGQNMSEIAPKNSYIDFKDFNNNVTGKTYIDISIPLLPCFIDYEHFSPSDC